MRRRHLGTGANRVHLLARDRAEEQVGDIALEHQIVTVAREDALEHPDRARDDGENREHRCHAKGDARHADQGPPAMAAEIREDEGKNMHRDQG